MTLSPIPMASPRPLPPLPLPLPLPRPLPAFSRCSVAAILAASSAAAASLCSAVFLCTTLGANFFFTTGAGEADVAPSALDSGAGVEAADAPPLPRNDPRPRIVSRAGELAAPPLAPLVLKLANLCTAGLPLPAGGGAGVPGPAKAGVPPMFAVGAMLATGAALLSCGADSFEAPGSAFICRIGSAAVFSTLT